MPRRVNPNLVKMHRNYTVEEAAGVLGVHKNTMRAWINRGLPVCDDRRPTLILGDALRGYLQQQRQTRKRRCKVFELYCLRCRTPKRPAADMADYEPVTATTGRITGLCPSCCTAMNRYVNEASLALISGVLDVSIPKAQRHISNSSEPLLNSDFTREL